MLLDDILFFVLLVASTVSKPEVKAVKAFGSNMALATLRLDMFRAHFRGWAKTLLAHRQNVKNTIGIQYSFHDFIVNGMYLQLRPVALPTTSGKGHFSFRP